MDIALDSTGFPLLFVSSLNLFAHLLPVTKVQFEEWLMLPDTPGDRFYDEAQIIRWRIEDARRARLHSGSLEEPRDAPQPQMPDSNERISWRHCNERNYERLFMTGVLPAEAQRFAQWLGPGYDLPTVGEWRAIATTWAQAPPVLPDTHNSLAANIGHKLYEITWPRTLLDQSLMTSGGVMEWVWDEHREHILWLGRPRTRFFGHTFRPLEHDPPAPRVTTGRLWFCGFRLVRRCK
jgi:hypothetical protein